MSDQTGNNTTDQAQSEVAPIFADAAKEHAAAASSSPAPDQPSAASRLATGIAQGAGVVSKEQGKNFFLHPIDTARNILRTQGELGIRAGKELKSGDYVRGVTHGIEYLLPGVGPTLAAAGDKLENKDYAGGIGTTIGAALPIVAGKAIPMPAGVAEEGAAGSMARPGTPAVRSIPPPEVAARAVTKAVNPAVNEWPGYMKATREEAGNIQDYAKRTNLPLNTQLDYVTAARGAAEEANNHFKGKILGPIENETVPTTGTGFTGANAGEGQTATLGEINKRIIRINDELRSAYSKRESGQTREALANEADLKAEQQALSDILHKELAKRTGLTPEQVGGLRQRYGRMYSIADQTEAAMNQRQSSAGKAVEGRRDVPTTAAGVGVDLFNRVVRGGPEGIANKAFVKALDKTKGIPVSDLPATNPPAPAAAIGRPIIPRGQLPQGTPIPIEETSPEELATQQERLGARQQGNIMRSRLASERRPIPLWKRGEQD